MTIGCYEGFLDAVFGLAIEADNRMAEIKKFVYQIHKQKDGAYTERNRILAFIANWIEQTYSIRSDSQWPNAYTARHPAEEVESGAWDEEWTTILVIEPNQNFQWAWHFHDSQTHLLSKLPYAENYKYKGTTTEEKYKQMEEYFKYG